MAAAALLWAASSTATVLTFDYGGTACPCFYFPFPNPALVPPDDYGDRVTTDSYIPANYVICNCVKTFLYGSAEGYTPNIVADYRQTFGAQAGWAPQLFGNLFEVVTASAATPTCSPQYIEITLTADPGFKVHLNSFDIANIVGPRLLPHLQVTRGNGAVLFAASAVPIDGGPAGTHTTFNNGGAGWIGQSLTIRLDAPFDAPLYAVNGDEAQARHISRYGVDNVSFSQVADTRTDDAAPVAEAITDRAAILATTTEDTSVNIAVLGAPLPVNPPYSYLTFTQGDHGLVAQNPDGTFHYTPARDFNGTDSFSYTIHNCVNSMPTVSIGAVVVTVTPVNDAPIAVADAVTIDEDTLVTVNVLANDTDVDGDTLTIQSVTQGAHGSTTLNADNTVIYQSAPNYYGEDSFTYTVSDGHGGTAVGTVTVTVSPVNDPPVAGGDSVTTLEDTSVNIPVLANDSDPEGDTMTLASFTQAAHGIVTSNPDGTLNYTPNLNFNGSDTFNYTVSDAALTSVGTVTISVTPVNDAPVASDDSSTTDEDTEVMVNVLTNDSDVEGDPLMIASFTQGAHGTVILAAANYLIYQPDPNFNGTDLFTYTVSDGNGGSATATVSVNVTPVNDPPIASNGTVTVLEDSAAEILLVASDPDGDSLTFSIATPPNHGTLSTVDGNQVTYTPFANYNGPDSFVFRANDGLATADAVVQITVGPVNDPPSLGPVTDRTVNEGAALTFQLTATDPEGDTLTFGSSDLPTGAVLNPATGEFAWTPNSTQAGAYPVTFAVTDPAGGTDSKTITIQVVDVPQGGNQDPDCSHAVPSISEIWPPNHKQTVVIDIVGVTDPDGDPVTVTITKILQDEPTNTLGDGSTWVDGGGIGTSRAWVRAERSGTPKVPGNGRVYEIFFTASDGHGGTCSNSVKVGAPHDQDHRPAIDDGVRYDSTVAGGPRVN